MAASRILAVTHDFPPMASAQSIQISRLIQGLDGDVTVLCADSEGFPQDPSIWPGGQAGPHRVIRIPDRRSPLLAKAELAADRLHLSWDRLPDPQRRWVSSALRRLAPELMTDPPDLLITFGEPMSDHLFGLGLRRMVRVPWIAHFSDPWTRNPFRRSNPVTAVLNARLERRVMEEADLLVFTSEETLEQSLRPYPAGWRERAEVWTHSFDKDRISLGLSPPADRYRLRHIGSFYGVRSPKPLLEGLEHLANQQPDLLEGVEVEFVGPLGRHAGLLQRYPLASRFVRLRGTVPYAESLRLMQEAHCLLAVDAPADLSVFFPSKLVEYLGSGRFVLAITPPGASERIVQEVGGVTADPRSPESVVIALTRVLRERPSALPHPTSRYERGAVAEAFNRSIARLTGHRPT